MPSFTQDGRRARITTPLGDNTVIPVSFVGTEALSQPYVFTVDLISETAGLDASRILGKEVTLHVERFDGEVRHVHGLVRRFSSRGTSKYLSSYRAEIVPALWFLSLYTDCRSFEKMTAVEVVEKVCKASGVTNIKQKITATPPTREYIVQYRETNLQFVSRLLEELGIYYTFEHTESSHTLVLSDAHAGSITQGELSTVQINSNVAGKLPLGDSIFNHSREYAVHTAKQSLSDHDLLRIDSTGEVASGGPHTRGERYEFQGDLGLDRASADAKLLIEAEELGHERLTGQSNIVSLASGTRVTLDPAPDDLQGKEFHIIEVTHKMEAADVHAAGDVEWKYENSFVAIPKEKHFRPARVTPRPTVRGTQIAKIIGSEAAGNIDVDDKGRVLIEFPWDRGAGKGGKSQHRVHVASVWGGKKWGFVQIPRIGQEVLVEYLEGDVDRPLITGRVFNKDLPHPYALPGNKTQTGWKSQTVEGGDTNFNEIRFDDKKGSEHVSVQAEKDMMTLVKNDETREVKHDRITTITNDETRTVKEGNDTHTVEKGNQVVTVKTGNQTIGVEKGNREVKIDTGNDTLKVAKGNLKIDVALGNITVDADAGSITIKAMQKIELKVGGNSIVIDMTGVTIKGMNVKSEAQMQAEFKGLMTKVDGSAMVEVHGGGMASLKADGMVMVKGSITMIN